jgi:hypothetical protein
MIGAHSL